MGGCCSCIDDSPPTGPDVGQWVRLGVAGVVAAQSMIFGLAINMSPPSGTARTILHAALALSAVAVFFLAGLPLVKRCWKALLSRRIVFDQLFLLGIFAAFGASVHCTFTGVGHVYYEIVAILIAIYTFGGLITESRRKEALSAAADLGSEFAQCEVVESDGNTRTKDIADVREGDRVWIRSGGAICVDGVVDEGISFVSESALTGEPFPVVKRPGDEVAAGSHAVEGGLKIRAAASGRGRRLDLLLEALREAQARPSRLQREADRLAAWFLPSVLVVATITFGLWTRVAGWEQGLFNALAVILVACPCAMGIATPVAIWSALASFVRRGLAPRDGDFVEKLANITSVVFDKTGTLGEEVMDVVDFVAAEGFDRAEVRRLAATLENASEHPIARAFRKYSDGGSVEGGVRLLPGAGVEGRVSGQLVRVGNLEIVEAGARKSARDLLRQSKASSPSTREVFVTVDGIPEAAALLRETLREGAREALAQLEGLGLRCGVMTGDRLEAATALGLSDVCAGMAPEEKARMVREREKQGERILFVGDGINDSAAMMEATASVAIRSGTALAAEASDAVLPGNALPSLAEAVTRGRAAVKAIRANLLFAACYNAVGITMAAFGFLHPVAAALIMLASSFTVTWRALREADEDRPPAPVVQRRRLEFPGWIVPASAAAIFLQGIFLSWLGALPQATTIGMLILFAGAALAIACLCIMRPLGAESAGGLLMFSVGGLAMLAGWWADAGFLPVVRDGVCLCNCPDSTLGLGIFGRPNWMVAGMLLASVPMLFVGVESRASLRWVCWVAGFVGMVLGMQAASWLASFLPADNPHLNFFAAYGAMLFGMALGMILACRIVRKVLK